MPDKFDEISKLLRLKRFEQPPPEYFENFLSEFHRRQRAELLREPLWRIALERIGAFFGEQNASRFGYGMATALVLVCATLASMNILNTPSGGDVETSGRVAVATPSVDASIFQNAQSPQQQTASLNLNNLNARPQIWLPDLNEISRAATAHSTAVASSSRPRYVMDARPVSYEPAWSF